MKKTKRRQEPYEEYDYGAAHQDDKFKRAEKRRREKQRRREEEEDLDCDY